MLHQSVNSFLTFLGFNLPVKNYSTVGTAQIPGSINGSTGLEQMGGAAVSLSGKASGVIDLQALFGVVPKQVSVEAVFGTTGETGYMLALQYRTKPQGFVLKLDATTVRTTATIVNAGVGYAVGDVLAVAGGTGGAITVVTINANGGVATFSVTAGSGYTSGAQATTSMTTYGAITLATAHAVIGHLQFDKDPDMTVKDPSCGLIRWAVIAATGGTSESGGAYDYACVKGCN